MFSSVMITTSLALRRYRDTTILAVNVSVCDLEKSFDKTVEITSHCAFRFKYSLTVRS